MKIKELFKKDITRDIQGVVTIGNEEEERKRQELEEYVCTKEVIENFRKFFSSYRKSIQSPTDKMGVWITGFFGSGKSHFLKILGYLLSNEIVAGKSSVDYFEDKINDQIIMGDIKVSASKKNLIVLFNIDSKAKSDAKNRSQAIMETMLSAFNERIGLSGSVDWLADLERMLQKDELYESFIETFEKISKKSWVEGRKNIFFERDNLISTLVKVKKISEESARAYFDDAQKNYSISTEKFAKIIDEYCEENNTRVVFLIDEVGQFIGQKSDLMLNLQTVVEDLGKYAKGKAWVVITSQQDIKDLVEGTNKHARDDFSKIQGRFATRLMMSSSNADEVIRKRLLEKTESAKDELSLTYKENGDRLDNLLMFPQKPKWTGYQNEKQFINDYPFVSYQYELLQATFTAIRENGMSEGKHIAHGERSLINAFQKGALSRCEDKIGVLVPFNEFYSTIEEFIDFDIKNVFERAKKRVDNSFDIEVLKVLFMLKSVKEMEPTLERLATLMVSSINEDKKVLKDKIKKSLDNLVGETFALQNGDRYEFLTNEEQDVNRNIEKSDYSTSEIANQIREIIYDKIVKISNKFSYNKYSFPLNRYIDDDIVGTANQDNLTVRIFTSWSEKTEEEIISLSASSDCLVIDLRDDSYLKELIVVNKIHTYDRNNRTGASSSLLEIITKKSAEAEERSKRAETIISRFIENCNMYLNGAKLSLTKTSPSDRFKEALEKLMNEKFSKLNYIKSFATKNDDIVAELKKKPFNVDDGVFNINYYSNANAAKAILDKISESKLTLRKFTMSKLIQDFSKPPFGYRTLDVRAIVAAMLVNNKVRCLKHDEVQDINSQNFIQEFSKGSQDDKLVIESQIKISKEELMEIKKIMKEAFSVTIEPKEQALKDESLVYFNDKASKLEHIYNNSNLKLPYKNIVNIIYPIFLSIVKCNDSEVIFKKIKNNKEIFDQYGEKIDSILNFYDENGTQLKKWYEAKELVTFYDANHDFIDGLNEIECKILEIKNILEKQEPASFMAKLYELISEVNNIKGKITKSLIDDTKKFIDETLSKIENDVNEILKEKFKNESTKDKISTLFENEKKIFKDLYDLLTDIDNCLRVKSKVVNEKKVFEEKINDILKNDIGDINKDIKTKTVTISDLIPLASRSIKSKDDIDRVVEKFKESLINLLTDNTEINIR